MKQALSRATLAALALACLAGAGAPEVAIDAASTAPIATAVEYYNAALDHYFVSSLQPDIDALDSGRTAGWVRTGETFRVYTSPGVAADLQPVCRFYIPPQHGDSHFLSGSAAECAAVAGKVATDPNYSGYVLETSAAFYVALPDATSGACATGLVPVYRLWNHRADSNHRYTASATTRAQMIARGYVPEGYGPDGVAMCVPASGPESLVRASGASPFAPGCDEDIATGVLYVNSEVEPRVDVDPHDPTHFVGVWQQDRWSDGGARGLLTGVSRDGGHTWARTAAAFTRCTGGADAGADYARASDPWTSFAPDGTVYQIAIAFTGPTFGPNGTNAVLVSRSGDGGSTWTPPTALIRDAQTAFNDKESITADPNDARYAYAVWDRTLPNGTGPTWFSRTTDGGETWEVARPIYDPGRHGQTLNNQIVVLPSGALLNFFTEFQSTGTTTAATLSIVRSADRGVTWSPPTVIAASLAIGVRDPETGASLRDAANLPSIAVGSGNVAIVWQDARASPGGTKDGVLFTRSVDGGLTWSAPARINAVPTVAAFVPTVKIRSDGTIGVTYYDFRNDTPDPATLPTDLWLTQSTDGVTWHETHAAGPFDLSGAPNARGLFLGDYQGLTTTPTGFLPFFALTTNDLANRTDIVADVTSAPGIAKAAAGELRRVVADSVTAPITPELERAASASAKRTLERRWHGSLPAPPPAR